VDWLRKQADLQSAQTMSIRSFEPRVTRVVNSDVVVRVRFGRKKKVLNFYLLEAFPRLVFEAY